MCELSEEMRAASMSAWVVKDTKRCGLSHRWNHHHATEISRVDWQQLWGEVCMLGPPRQVSV